MAAESKYVGACALNVAHTLYANAVHVPSTTSVSMVARPTRAARHAPTRNGQPQYSSTTSVSAPTNLTIKAYATNSAKADSTIASATYVTFMAGSGTWTNNPGDTLSWKAQANWLDGILAFGATAPETGSLVVRTLATALAATPHPMLD